MFAIGLVWFMIIVGLKIAGPKKVGFLAGKLEHPEYDIAARTRDVGELDTVIEEDQLEASQPDVSSESRSLLESDCDSPLIITNTIDADYEAATVDDKFKKKVTAVRMTFVLSGLAMIVCGSLFYCKGMSAVRRSLVDISQGLQVRLFIIDSDQVTIVLLTYFMPIFCSSQFLSSSMTLPIAQKRS